MNLGQAALHTIEQTVEHAVEHARHLLPIQGPIGVFVHHNTLHAFQHLPFDDAVEIGARTFNAEPWLPEQTLRHAYLRGRIRDQDIDDVTTTLDDTPLPGLPWSQRSLRRALLRGGAVAIAPAEARFLVDERHATSHLRHDLEREARAALLEEGDEHYVATSLWRAVTHLVTSTPHAVDNTPARPRDGVLALTGTDIDVDIDALFMRLAVAFLDQGVSLWPMPHRERGLLHAARDLITAPTFIAPPCLVGLAQRLVAHDDALALLTNSLNDLGVDDDSITDIVAREALALPGVFGMLSRLEHDPHLLPHVPVPASLIEALALRFCMVATAVANTLPKTSTSWRDGIAPTDDDESHTLATSLHVVFALQGLGVSAGRLRALGDEASAVLVREIAAFDELSRRRLLHAAFERRHTHQVLEPLAQHTHTRMTTTTKRPRMQLICCIDEREESLRRAVEELSPDVETFGAAGFFGIAIAYRGLDDGKAQARCPVVVTPWHAIREAPRPEQEHLGRRRALERKAIAAVRRNLLLGSRAMVRGFITTAALGVLSLVPASSRLLFPRAVARLRARVTELFLASPETRLELAHDHIADDHGFSQDEQADVVAGLLLPMALVKEFARLVVVLGHGATSQNNPHDSAYQCGACGGLPGGPNARLFANMQNKRMVSAP